MSPFFGFGGLGPGFFGGGQAPPLDLVIGSAAAFGLRKLRTAYSGSAIRVRRSSDSAETDIGFTGNDLDTTALLAHCGSGDGFVVTWYDQSGNGRDLTQSTAANQPQLISAGVLITNGGRPTMLADGSNDVLVGNAALRTITNNIAGYTNLLVGGWQAFGAGDTYASSHSVGTSGSTRLGVATSSTGQRKIVARRSDTDSAWSVSTTGNYIPGLELLANIVDFSTATGRGRILRNNSEILAYTNFSGFSAASATSATNAQVSQHFATNTALYGNYEASERIEYTRILTDNELNTLSANQSAYYGITNPAPLDLVVGAAAAFGLRKLRAGYAGSAIRVRRSSDNAEADIGFTGNDLDITALLAHCGAGSGFVVTWYDQSGNSRNATQSTTANQPRIVNAGVVDVSSGRPSIFFDGINDDFLVGGTANAMSNGVAGITGITVINSSSADLVRYAWNISTGVSAANGRLGFAKTAGGNIQGAGRVLDADGGAFPTSSPAFNTPTIATALLDVATPFARIFGNGTQLNTISTGLATSQSTTSATNSNAVRIGSRTSGFFSGYMSELIFYMSALSGADRLLIERNQGAYHGITVA